MQFKIVGEVGMRMISCFERGRGQLQWVIQWVTIDSYNEQQIFGKTNKRYYNMHENSDHPLREIFRTNLKIKQ